MSTRRGQPSQPPSEGIPAEFLGAVGTVVRVSATAARNRKRLRGTGYYADAFHKGLVALAKAELAVLASIPDSAEKSPFAERLAEALDVVRSTDSTHVDRVEAARALHQLIELELPQVVAMAAGPVVPATQAVVPMAVVAGTRGYLESLALQVNGCFEKKWFDATAVLMRRLIEVLIVDIYENRGEVDKLLDVQGRVRPLSELVAVMRGERSWKLNKETDQALEDVRNLGNLAAHQRRYKVRKPDVEALLRGFRLAIDELVHLANYK